MNYNIVNEFIESTNKLEDSYIIRPTFILIDTIYSDRSNNKSKDCPLKFLIVRRGWTSYYFGKVYHPFKFITKRFPILWFSMKKAFLHIITDFFILQK